MITKEYGYSAQRQGEGHIVKRLLKLILVAAVCTQLSACDDPQVYGSVGVSSWGGSSGLSGGISIGGRIM